MPLTKGCRCPECFGLAEYMLEHYGHDYGLPPAPGHRSIRLVENECTGAMDCSCKRCKEQRAALVKRGGIGGGNQPWHVAKRAA